MQWVSGGFVSAVGVLGGCWCSGCLGGLLVQWVSGGGLLVQWVSEGLLLVQCVSGGGGFVGAVGVWGVCWCNGCLVFLVKIVIVLLDLQDHNAVAKCIHVYFFNRSKVSRI